MDADYGGGYRRLYEQHWWWRAREHILTHELRALQIPPDADILDFGCGDALTFPLLGRFGRVCGIEVDRSLVSEASPWRQAVFHAPLGSPEYADWQFDLITALDALEHIEDDAVALHALCAMLRPGGRILLTVPAFMSLWDRHDEINRHYRRYRKIDVLRLVPAPMRVSAARYLFPGLYPLKWLVARINRGRARAVEQHRIPAGPVNTLMRLGCIAEYHLLRRLPLPFGTSLLVVIERPVLAGDA